MDAKAKRPKVTWMVVALITATTMTSSGCAKLYHVIRYNCVSRLVGESHRTYYHGPGTGKIIPREKRQCNVYEPACYGYEATCWHRWPEGCGECMNKEEVIYDGPYSSAPMEQPTYATEAEPVAVPNSDDAEDAAGGTQRLPEVDAFDGGQPEIGSPASPSDGADVDFESRPAPRNLPPTTDYSQRPVQRQTVRRQLEVVEERVSESLPTETLPAFVEEVPELTTEPSIPLRESELINTRETVATPAIESSELGLGDEEVSLPVEAPALGSTVSRRVAPQVERVLPAEAEVSELAQRVRTTVEQVDLPSVDVETPVVVPQLDEEAGDAAEMIRGVVDELPTVYRENQRRFAERFALELPTPRRNAGPVPAPLEDDGEVASADVPSFSVPVTKAQTVAVAEQLELTQEQAVSSELRFSNDRPQGRQELGRTTTELKFR